MDSVDGFGWRFTRHNQTDHGDTRIVRNGAGVLHAITINLAGTGSGNVVIYDGTSAAGTAIMTFTPTALDQPVCLVIDARFTTGLFIDGSTSSDAWEITLYHN